MVSQKQVIALDTFGGRIHVEWDPAAAVTPLGQLPFFIEFLNVSGLFEGWVSDCPLTYQSNTGSDKRAVLATLLLSVLAGHPRYAHISAIRHSSRAGFARGAGKAENRALKEELKQIKRELARKEKALAEAAALLILKKKSKRS